MKETLSDIGEFGLIHRIDTLLKKEDFNTKGTVVGIGDDTASILPKEGFELLITCDSVVEGRHFLLEYMNFYDLGRRAMTVNISDIGAMGGVPLYALISLGLMADINVSDIEDMYRGFIAELKPFSASIIGGNITKVESSLFVDITLIGEIKAGQTVRRSTARIGDAILVTGYPGEAAAGLDLLLHRSFEHIPYEHPLIKAYVSPGHRALEGFAIASTGLATAMIDTSDGLLSDLAHICSDSGVGADLSRRDLPVSKALRDLADQNQQDPYELCTRDSDDYELVITCAPEHTEDIKAAIHKISDVPVSTIGTVTDEEGVFQWKLPDGSRQPFSPRGWDHFSKKGKHQDHGG